MTEIAIEARESSIEALAEEFDPISHSNDSVLLDEPFADVVEFVTDEELPTDNWEIGMVDNSE